MRSSALPLTILSVLLWAAAPSAQELDLPQRFEALDDAGDLPGLEALWRAHEGEVLYTIDAYLERGLRLWEEDAETNGAEIERLGARALRGALAADRAFGRTIFSDYASSFLSWGPNEKTSFRHGQEMYDRARNALGAGQLDAARNYARHAVETAELLGDWWGQAMGLLALGTVEERRGESRAALTAHRKARLLHQQLGLRLSELRSLHAMARLGMALGQLPSARISLERGLEIALGAQEFGRARALLGLSIDLATLEGDLEAERSARALLESLPAQEGD